MQVPRKVIPCNGCTFCCQSDAIYLHPEYGDNADNFEIVQYQNRTILKHQPNGDCIYLDRQTGCTIWGKQPAFCQGLDCRRWLLIPKKERLEMIKARTMTKKHFVIAKKMKFKMLFLKEIKQ